MFGLIYYLIWDQGPIFGTLGIISAFLSKKVSTIGIEQAIVCNSTLGIEKISPTDLHITWQKCPKIWWKQTAIQLVV